MSRRSAVLQDYGGSFVPMDFQTAMEANQLAEQRRQHDNQMKMHEADRADQKAKDAEADKYRKLKMIDDATDPTGYQSSTQKANSLATQQLLGVRNEFAGKTNLPPDQLYLELQQKLTPVAQGYNSYKADLTGQEALAKKAVEVNPNLDMQKILVDLQKQVDSHHLVNKDDGTIDFNQATLGTDSNALQEILKPENAWKYSKGTKPLIDAVAGKGQDGELFAKAPDGSQINYKTKIPNWAQLVDQDGNPLEVDPKTGLIPKGKKPTVALKGTMQQYQETGDDGKPLFDRQGNPVMSKMIVVPKSTMREILSNDATEYAFEGAWQKHKQLGNIQTTPAEEEDLKQIYFSQWLKDNGLSQPTVSNITHLPPQPRVTNNIRVDGAKGEPTINNVWGKINDYFDDNEKPALFMSGKNVGKPMNNLNADAAKVILSYVSPENYNEKNTFIRRNENGDVELYETTEQGGKNIPIIDGNKLLKVFDRGSINQKGGVQPNSKAKEADLKQENNNAAQSGKPNSKPTTGYTNVQTLQDSKGKSIQAGVKNGKWYDVKTGKPIE